MNGLLLDLRYGWRALAKNRAFTVVSLLSLTLAIGANATIFCWIQNTVRRPLAGVEDSDSLVTLTRVRGANLSDTVSYPEVADYAGLTQVFSGVAAFQQGAAMVRVGRESDWLFAQIVSGNFFQVLGVRPALGRAFTADDDRTPGGHPVIVISDAYWKRRFGRSPDVIGRAIEVNRRPFRIVGVAPAGFAGALAGLRCDFWAPLMMHDEVAGIGTLDNRNDWWIFLLGRLRPGVGIQQAQAAVNVRAEQLARTYPASNAGVGVRVGSLAQAPYGAPSVILPLVPILLAVGIGVLLIVSANVANLLLARATGRHHEIAIRLAVGAGRGRIVRQLLVESLLLSSLGGAAGVLFATWAAQLLEMLVPKSNMPIGLTMTLDAQVLALTALVTVAAGIIFGLAPALQAVRANVGDPLKGARGGSAAGAGHRLRSGLVVAETALTFVLLVGAGLCLKGFERARRVDVGFDPSRVLAMDLRLNASGYTDETARTFYRDLLARTRAVPGVTSAALTGFVPLGFEGGARTPVQVPGYLPAVGEEMNMSYTIVSPGYFDTMRVPLRGRDFADRDDETRERVAVVNEAFAKRFWPDRDPIGRVFTTWSTTQVWSMPVKIVGVAKTGKYRSLAEQPQPMIYLSYLQRIVDLDLGLVARTGGDPATLAQPLRATVHAIDSGVEPLSTVTMRDYVQAAFFGQRVAATALAVLGTAALLLAGIGIYGVMAFVVGQRLRELAIRIALGARPRTIVMMIAGEGLSLAAIGVMAGLAATAAVTPLMSSLLFGLSPMDPTTYLGVIAVVVGSALAACCLPALRATKADPITVLRCE